jgi:hypothetical protein
MQRSDDRCGPFAMAILPCYSKRILNMFSKWLVCLSPLLLAGCMGLDSNSSPKETFTVPVSYEQVYLRARDQAERCWRGETGYPLGGGVNSANRTAQLYVSGDFGSGRMGQVDARALSETSSEVTVTVWGINIWDRAALAAMHEVIEFGVPTCTSYMPQNPIVIQK